MLKRIHSISFVVFLLLQNMAFSFTTNHWIKINLPNQMIATPIDGTMNVNGTPMQISVFVSSLDAEQLSIALKKHFNTPLLIQHVGDQIIAGMPCGTGSNQGHYYLTIQIENLITQTQSNKMKSKGIIALSHIKAASDQRSSYQEEKNQWQQKLPAGSVISSYMQSDELTRHSHYLTAYNQSSLDFNAKYLKQMLLRQGFKIENTSLLSSSKQHIFQLTGTDKEGMITLSKNEAGQTMIVMNLLLAKGRLTQWTKN